MFKKIILIMFLAGLLSVNPAFADVSEDKTEDKIVEKIEKYLNNLSTFKADFVQIDSMGMLSDGKFYLSRPAKFRWEYNQPVPIVIVASGGWVNYYDTELKQSNSVLLSATPAGILADENISIKKENIEKIENVAGITSIKISDDEKEGKITLSFQNEPMLLESMIVEDAMGNKTNIIFSHQETGVKFKKKLFWPLNPHEYNQPNRL